MTIPYRQSIALISLARDLELSERSTPTLALRSLAEALSKLGWQIDIFTRKIQPDRPSNEWVAPYCRVIRLAVQATDPDRQVPQFVRAFQAFQTKDGMPYPLLHTFDELSARVGAQLKQQSNLQWLHTRWQWQQQSQWLADRHVVFSTKSWDLRTGNSSKIGIDSKTARIKLGLSTTEPAILCDASAQSEGEIRLAIAALSYYWQQYSNWRCLLVTPDDVPQANGIVSLAKSQLGQQIIPIPQEQRDWAYAAADLCLITSLHDPLGTTALKALDCGIPAIVPDIGAFRFAIVPGETGQLVAPGDPKAIARAIDRFFSDEVWTKRRQRQAEAWELSTDSDWNRVAAHLSHLYRQHLAVSVGATHPEIPHCYSLQVPDTAVVSEPISAASLYSRSA